MHGLKRVRRDSPLWLSRTFLRLTLYASLASLHGFFLFLVLDANDFSPIYLKFSLLFWKVSLLVGLLISLVSGVLFLFHFKELTATYSLGKRILESFILGMNLLVLFTSLIVVTFFTEIWSF